MRTLKKISYKVSSFFRPRLHIVYLEEEPAILDYTKIYVIGKNGYQWYAVMVCPCGCKEKIYLNLLQDSFPCWKLNDVNGIPSISPSIWKTKGCRSHFIINTGKLYWVW